MKIQNTLTGITAKISRRANEWVNPAYTNQTCQVCLVLLNETHKLRSLGRTSSVAIFPGSNRSCDFLQMNRASTSVCSRLEVKNVT